MLQSYFELGGAVGDSKVRFFDMVQGMERAATGHLQLELSN